MSNLQARFVSPGRASAGAVLRWRTPPLSRPSRPPSGALLLSGLLLIAGCTLDAPKAPTFETRIYLPLGDQTTTGRDLIEDSEYISGDTTGTEPLIFVMEGEAADFQVDSALDIHRPDHTYEAHLSEIQIDPPAPRQEVYPFSKLHQAPVPSGVPQVVAPFSFQADPVDLEPMESFRWVRLSSGLLTVEVQNDSDLDFGGAPDTALVVSVVDRENGEPVLWLPFLSKIPARQSVILAADLRGRSFHDDLRLAVRGSSPGSNGRAVLIGPDDGVSLTLRLDGLSADSCLAPVPAQVVSVESTIGLASDIHLEEAEVLEGDLDLTLLHGIPLPASVEVKFPELSLDGQPYPLQQVRVPAGGMPPSEAELIIPLAGATATAPPGQQLSEISFVVTVRTDPVQEPVSLGTRQKSVGFYHEGIVRLNRLRGVLEERQVEVSPTETSFDLPEGISELDFADAALTLEIESSVEMPARADLLLRAIPAEGGAPVEMTLDFDIPAAPEGETGHTVRRWDRGNSNILEVIRAAPQHLILSGALGLGGLRDTGTVRRSDLVRARYSVTAPMHARIGEIRHRADPFSVTFSQDEQDQIMDHLGSVRVQGEVENHLPAGLTARIVFADEQENLEAHPAVEVDSIRVEAAEIGSDGRAIRSTTTPFDVEIPEEDVAFFARPRFYGRVMLVVRGADQDRLVQVTAADYVSVRGMMQLRVKVAP